MSRIRIAKELRQHPERGSVSVYVVIIAASLMLMAGLCVEGGRVLNARSTMADQAEQAARVGVQQLSMDKLRGSGVAATDPSAASSAARSYLARTGNAQTSTVKASSDRVSVTVERDVPTTMLRLVGIPSIHVSVTGEARNDFGPKEQPKPGLPKTGDDGGPKERPKPRAPKAGNDGGPKERPKPQRPKPGLPKTGDDGGPKEQPKPEPPQAGDEESPKERQKPGLPKAGNAIGLERRQKP
ncbi:TadE family protein [Actinomyces oris]|uniref:TadE family protein n=1 Tax=Actinomyces oris TaxID=544580 RepID=UPI000A802120|nr:TadE/TadG family type IV pilus assembly protein [Actinomyces oris]